MATQWCAWTINKRKADYFSNVLVSQLSQAHTSIHVFVKIERKAEANKTAITFIARKVKKNFYIEQIIVHCFHYFTLMWILAYLWRMAYGRCWTCSFYDDTMHELSQAKVSWVENKLKMDKNWETADGRRTTNRAMSLSLMQYDIVWRNIHTLLPSNNSSWCNTILESKQPRLIRLTKAFETTSWE